MLKILQYGIGPIVERDALIAPEQPEPCWLIIPASYRLQLFALNPVCVVLLLYYCCTIVVVSV